MTTSQYLAQFGVSLQDAKNFIMANINNVGNIYTVAKSFGITNQMLAEIYGGVTANDVKNFFQAHGFDPNALENMVQEYQSDFLDDDMNELSFLVSLNTYSGELSTASLRAKIIANTNEADYNKAFSPTTYNGYSDGTFSASDLGFSHLGNLSATQETVESLFFGTTIKAYKAIDMNEIMEIQSFIQANQAAIASGNTDVLSQHVDLMISVFEDAANPQIIPDSQIADLLVLSGTTFVEVVSTGDSPSLMDGMLMGFI